MGVKILKSERAWAAVCRGATHWGLERYCPRIIESRRSRYNYGISRWLGDIDGRGRFLDSDRMSEIDWLLKKGDEILDGHKIELNCYRTTSVALLDFGSRRFYDAFLYCGNDEPPQHVTDDVKPIGYLPWEGIAKGSDGTRNKSKWRENRFGNSSTQWCLLWALL
ncbi:hypothetical protein K440DRAFT_611281 [Wilcoxina mikolae CBS 423.85]|nr:hypothetical protein K440DRAFT_611281 [Wilcoxina mikolae CBS 423.85]